MGYGKGYLFGLTFDFRRSTVGAAIRDLFFWNEAKNLLKTKVEFWNEPKRSQERALPFELTYCKQIR